MAITTLDQSSATISGTEYSAVSHATYNSGSTFSTADGVYQFFFDLQDMTTGDELQIRVYEKVRSGDTQRVVYQQNLFGPQASDFVFPSLVLMHGWDVTLKAISGTIDVAWAIQQVA